MHSTEIGAHTGQATTALPSQRSIDHSEELLILGLVEASKSPDDVVSNVRVLSSLRLAETVQTSIWTTYAREPLHRVDAEVLGFHY